MLYPLLFQPNLHTVVWGGHQLQPYKGLPATDDPVGESWEVSAVPSSTSIISNGPLAGHDLISVVTQSPDAILGLGFTDDILALAWAVFSMRKYITPEIKQKARDRVRQWLGPEDGEASDLTRWHVSPDDPRIIDVEAEEY